MEETFNFSQVPHDYPMCLNRQCPQAGSCLHQLVEQMAPTEIQQWTFISPKYLASINGDCPYYRSTEKIRLAKGFIRILDSLPYKQMRIVISHLMSYFNRRTYFRVRKGERLLSPAEQRRVLRILENCGVSHPQEFDTYVESYNWWL